MQPALPCRNIFSPGTSRISKFPCSSIRASRRYCSRRSREAMPGSSSFQRAFSSASPPAAIRSAASRSELHSIFTSGTASSASPATSKRNCGNTRQCAGSGGRPSAPPPENPRANPPCGNCSVAGSSLSVSFSLSRQARCARSASASTRAHSASFCGVNPPLSALPPRARARNSAMPASVSRSRA